jgi:hypothetical protein
MKIADDYHLTNARESGMARFILEILGHRKRKILLWNLHLPAQARFGLAELRQSAAESVGLYWIVLRMRQLGRSSRFHIQIKQAQQELELLRRNSGTPKYRFRIVIISFIACSHCLNYSISY